MMATIDKTKLDAMLAEVPEEERDNFLTDFKRRGHTIASSQATPESYLMGLAKSAYKAAEPALSAQYSAFRLIADPVESLGRKANEGWQKISEAMQHGLGNPQNPNPMPPSVQALGRGIGKVAPFLNPIPTSDLGMATLPFVVPEAAGAIGNRFGQASKSVSELTNVPGLANEGFGAVQEATPGIKAGKESLQKAGPIQQALAQALSAVNRVKPKQLAGIIANPEILSESTPTSAEVSQMYSRAFEDAGMKIDDARYKFLTGSAWPLRSNQIARAQQIVDMAFDPLRPGQLRQGLTDSEAFIARTATAKIMDSAPAASSPSTLALAGRRQEMLDDYLENSSLPNIRQLSRLWFMARAKEAMLAPLPLNKQATPNALSSLLMMGQFKKALEQAGEGQLGRAAVNVGAGAMMSPAVGGTTIKAGQWVGQNPGATSSILVNVLGGGHR